MKMERNNKYKYTKYKQVNRDQIFDMNVNNKRNQTGDKYEKAIAAFKHMPKY